MQCKTSYTIYDEYICIYIYLYYVLGSGTSKLHATTNTQYSNCILISICVCICLAEMRTRRPPPVYAAEKGFVASRRSGCESVGVYITQSLIKVYRVMCKLIMFWPIQQIQTHTHTDRTSAHRAQASDARFKYTRATCKQKHSNQTHFHNAY